MDLTNEQKQAILTIEGNICCMASAGSGKTQSFTTRIAHMVKNKGINPMNILAISYTKLASEEMKKRLNKMIGKEKTSKLATGTFHSICYRLLKILDPEFAKLKIAPDWWRFSLINDICKMGNDKNPNGMNLGIRAGELASFISYQKSNAIEPHMDVIIDDNVDYVDCVPRKSLQEAFRTYERVKSSSRQIDFDDMLLYMYKKITTDSEFRKRVGDQYKYVMIDEFQDSSKIVIEIIKHINDYNVFVVGDYRQSIYKFINANVENILNFKDNFKNVKLIELNKNFRSTQNIVSLSNQIIDNSPIEKYKEYLHSESVAEVGDKVSFTLYQDEKIQIERIADKVEELHEEGTDLKEIAILVRTNAQTATIEDVFADRDIPYDVSKSTSFFDRKEVLDILSYARVAVDNHDDASFRRIYNTPNRYLSKVSLEELDSFASDRDLSLASAIKMKDYPNFNARRNVEAFSKILDDLKYQVQSNVNAGRLIRNIIKSTRYVQYINDTTTNASQIDGKLESIDKLCEMGARFPTISAFLAHIISIKDKQKKAKGKDAVQVVTIHSSKGLEWDAVFVTNANEDLMPHHMNSDIEEERRLFYVACSRPRKKLFVSWFCYDVDVQIVKEGLFITELLGEEKTKEMKKQLFRGSREVTEWYPSN